MHIPSKADKRRFMAKVRKTAGCWLWLASVDTKGYGQLGFTGMAGGLIKAHRFSWLLHKGPLPAKHKVRQSCGNRRCVRPKHLYISEEHRPGNYFTLDAQTRNFLDGLLLGDGSYDGRKFSAALTIGQRADRVGWLRDIQTFLAKRGVPLAFAKRTARTNRCNGQKIYTRAFMQCRTPAYRTLLAEHRRWYKRGQKRVPRDLDLTDPMLLAQWYMGDGNVYSENRRGVVEVALNTQGFSLVDVRWLASEFARKLDLRAFVKRTSIHRGRQPILALSCHSARRFVELVRPYISPVFNYKVPVPVRKRNP